jgi:hypothetical protein
MLMVEIADINGEYVAWLMREFANAFNKNCKRHGMEKMRIYEMLNALALEAASIVTAPEDRAEQKLLYDWFKNIFMVTVAATLEEEEDQEDQEEQRKH